MHFILYFCYLQVEFQNTLLISGILTQGSPDTIARVTHFSVTYSKNCIDFHFIRRTDGTPYVSINRKQTQIDFMADPDRGNRGAGLALKNHEI